MRYLDANVLLRYLTRDDPAKAQACLDLLRRVEAGAEEVTTSEVILHEVLYVLTSSRTGYGLSHVDAAARLRPILALRGLKLSRKRDCLRALDHYTTYPNLDFGDALAVAQMERQGIGEIYSYDRDFDRVSGVRRVEP